MNFRNGIVYWLPSFICTYMWVVAISALTNLLASFGVTFFTAGILVVLPALLMPFHRGLTNVILSGFLVDATIPIPFEMTNTLSFFAGTRGVSLFGDVPDVVPAFFGFITGWMIFAYLILRLIRPQVDMRSPFQWMICAMLVNSVIFFFWGLAMGWAQISVPAYWLGFAVNFALSSVLLFAIGSWFFDLQLCAYRLCGIDLVEERDVECA